MNTTSIAVINGQTIQVNNDERQLVPIKPICAALGVADERQASKIKEHPILGPTATRTVLVAADGKTREMACLPIKYIYGWLFTTQLEKIQNHPAFGGAVVPLRGTTGADGKKYEMKCLPLEYIFG